MTVKTAVIAAAGLGTRFLPISKAIPKELLPLIDRPLIQHAVEQAVDAGIDRIIIVTPPDNELIRTYFEPSPKLEEALAQRGNEKLTELKKISGMISPVIVHQDAPGGLGQAILCAKHAVGDSDFVIYLPDDLVVNIPSLTRQLLNIFDSYGPVVAVERITPDKTSSYGVISGKQVEDRVFLVEDVIEKPSPASAPSNLGIVGQYVLPPSIFECLESLEPGALGEIQLTDGISMIARETKVYAYEFEGKRYDCGTPLGLLRASVEHGLNRVEFRQEIKDWVKRLASELDDQ